MVTGPMLLVILLVAIGFIILGTARWKLNAFLALLLTAYGVGLAARMPAADIASNINSGFGGLMTGIGLVIILGTIIGVFLEKSGAAVRMAETVLRVVGEKRPGLAMNIIGYIVSIPVFCDSGFVILSSLNRALAKRSRVSLTSLAVALSLGLYATHVMVPPTPGPLAAAGNLKVENLALVIFIGLIAAIPTSIAGYLWSKRFAKEPVTVSEADTGASLSAAAAELGSQNLPSAWLSFAPIVVPILLIAIASVANFPSKPFGAGSLKTALVFLGTPVTALLIGVGFALLLVKKLDERVLSGWIGEALKASATILIITGAGGSLGKILAATNIGAYLGQSLAHFQLGIFLPFIIAAALKTAQGSSTVALVTTSALVEPLLGSLGLASVMGRVLTVMAVAAGSMVVSHANDSYFWVVSQFSDMDVTTAYRAQTIGTLVQGLVGIATVFVLTLVLL